MFASLLTMAGLVSAAALGPASKQNFNRTACANSLPAGVNKVTITSSGKSRDFEVFVPNGLSNNNLRPGLFMWHGYGASPEKVRDFTGYDTYAETEKWFVIYPVGTGLIKGFNGAGCCPGVSSNDVQFAKDIIAKLSADLCLDTNHVFSTGFSNGGFMTNKLACEATEYFAGIAIHSGLIGNTYTCNPSKGVPAIMFHGDADPTVPYNGNGQWLSFANMVKKWSELNNCGNPDDNAYDSVITETTTCVRFDKCGRDNAPLEYCSITGLDHNWSGPRNFDVDATKAIIDFFKALL